MKLAIRLAACAASAGIVLSATGAPAHTGTAAQARKVSHQGVGEVKIGMRYSVAQSMGLVGPLEDGCELDNFDSAELRAPLEGFVDVTRGTPPRIRHISVRGGATARGVGVGSPLSAVLAAFSGAKVKTVPEFDLTYVRVSRSAGGKFDFLLRKGARQRVRSIEVRRFFICD